MTRSFSRFFLAEGSATLGIGFGAWLLHHAFQPTSDTPLFPLVLLGAFDIFLCVGMLCALLRFRLLDGGRLPKSWFVCAVVLAAGFLGWTLALLVDAERLRAEAQLHEQADPPLAQVEDAVRHFQSLLPAFGAGVDQRHWEPIHDQYARAFGHLYASVRDKPDWQKQLAQADEYVQKVNQVVDSARPEIFHLTVNDARANLDRAEQMTTKLRSELADGQRDLAVLYRTRWHQVGSAALTGVIVLLGTLCFWLVFDRELRRRQKAQMRLAASEERFRSLVEHQPEAVAVLDDKACIAYVNPAWKTCFNYKADDLQGRSLFDLIHPADRGAVQAAYDKQEPGQAIVCRLSADYGIWHDVEMQCQEYDVDNATAVRFRNLRESADPAAGAPEPAILKLPEPLLAHDVPALVYTYDPATRRFLSVSNFPSQVLGYPSPASSTAPEFLMSLVHPEDDARVLRALTPYNDHGEHAVLEDEIRLRDSAGQYQWFGVYHRAVPHKIVGVAFPIQRQKRAEEQGAEAERQLHAVTESERQARAELDALGEHKKNHESTLREHESKHKRHEKALRERDEHRQRLEDELREHAGHRQRLEDEVRGHTGHRERLEEELEEHRGHRSRLEDELREHKEHRHRLERELGEHRGHRDGLENELNEHKEHRNRLEGELGEHREHRRRLEAELGEHRGHREKLEAELGEHRGHREKLEGEVNDHREHRQRLSDQIRQLEERCLELEDAVRDREERCRKLEHRMRDHDRHREELEATVRDHQDRLHDFHSSHARHADTLKASKEAMRRLASGVANDFNKILSVVLGYTDVLRESFPKDHMAQNYVDEMRQAASHGAELTQKLLAFSRNHLLQMMPVEMNHQLAALESKMQDAVGRDVKLEWDRTHEELWVKTDPHPLEQALVHLLTHVRQRLPRGATLTVRTRRVDLAQKDLTHADMTPGSYVQICLCDQANEMDEATREHLFEPYFASKEGHKSDLGLATANGIIRQSGGCIDVESEPGLGSEIVIKLPSTDERPQAAAVA